MTGELVYFWIPVPDADRAMAFYGGLLGWEFAPGSMPEGYQITNSSPPGGLHGGEKASIVPLCFQVDALDGAIARVRELGGEANEPQPTESGHYVLCRDDQGTEFCLWASLGSV